MKSLSTLRLAGFVVSISLVSPSHAFALEPHERLITILGTNDIHGGVEPSPNKEGAPSGGLAFFAGVVRSIKQGLSSRYAAQAGVLVLDAGDQFQGTLVSNFNEGQLVFAAMNEVGYDAAIPGNHDYDFGPTGWLDDQVTASNPDKDPRGALLRLSGLAKFPLLSANTYLKESLVDSTRGSALEVQSSGCKLATAGEGVIDWAKAKRPSFLKPYIIREAAGLRVAIIGLDNPSTPQTTTEANVSDLCFDDEAQAYTRVHAELEGRADLFVIIVHDGNTQTTFDVSRLVERLRQGSVDAVISGHTHYMTNTRSRGIPIIQSNSGGDKFGRIDLVYNTVTHSVDPAKTRSWGGVEMVQDRCMPSAKDFCSVAVNGSAQVVSYEGVPVVSSEKILELTRAARAQVAPIASRKLGVADQMIRVDRIHESALANAMTDALRQVSSTDLAFMNTGGIRAPIDAGEITYEDLFKVIPFGNHGLEIGPMGAEQVLALLERSIKSCGSYGALMQSGLRVTFERIDCKTATDQMDPDARLLKVETLEGEVIYNVEKGGVLAPSGRTFQVSTLDFLATGGAGYEGFRGTPVIRDLGIVREAMTEFFLAHPAHFTSQIDGRWKEVLPKAE